jgi:hypothetical protein
MGEIQKEKKNLQKKYISISHCASAFHTEI